MVVVVMVGVEGWGGLMDAELPLCLSASQCIEKC